MTGRAPNTAEVAGGRRGKDDRKQNTLSPLHIFLVFSVFPFLHVHTLAWNSTISIHTFNVYLPLLRVCHPDTIFAHSMCTSS